MSTARKPRWPWLIVIAIPLWLMAVIGEIMDAKLLEAESVTVSGRIEAPQWSAGRRGGRHLQFEAAYELEGRSYRHLFKLPAETALNYVDNDAQILQPAIEVRCARSKPEVAALVIQPTDPVWVSMILAGVGFCVLCGVLWYLVRNGFWTRK